MGWAYREPSGECAHLATVQADVVQQAVVERFDAGKHGPIAKITLH
jgi:hypothetical protein